MFYLFLAIGPDHRGSLKILDTIGARFFLFLALLGTAGMLLIRLARNDSYLLLAAVAIGVAIFAVRHAAWKRPLTLLAGGVTVTSVLSLAWWQTGWMTVPDPVAPLPLIAFAAILGCLAVGISSPRGRRPNTPAILLVVFLVAGFLLLIDLNEYRPGDERSSYLAHNWGAFIGPALHLRAGLVPFFDIPLQYGLGPTLAIAAACHGADCWRGMECVVVFMDLACGLLILRMALATSAPRGWLWCGTVTIVMFAAVFLWPGEPAYGGLLLATPSVSGIRFLPTTLVAYLLFFGCPQAAAAALVPAVLWSPESAGMAIAVFGLCETARVGLARAILRSAGLLGGSYACLILLHRVTFGVWMDPAALLEYALHVPGPLPIDPLSDTLLLAVALGLGGWLMVRLSPDPVTARHDRTAAALLFAATVYWLGRSHPNNICNLMPFLALVALRVLDRPIGARSPLADTTGFALATSVAALAMVPWQTISHDPHVTIDIRPIVADFRLLEPDVEWIRGQINNPDGLGIADFGPNFMRHPSEKVVWTPMDPSALWPFVPSERRQLYIRRSSARLRRSGWVIFEDMQRFLFDDFRAGYTIAEQRDFAGMSAQPGGLPTHYTAVCLNPRPDIAVSTIGPACPSGKP
jgi:hypothetical protein